MGSYVSDDVWQRLDAHTGRLSRRAKIRMWLAGVVAVVTAVAVAAVWDSGAIYPRLGWGSGTPAFHYGGREAGLTVDIRNVGWTSLTVVGIGRSGPGFELTYVSPIFPVTLQPGEVLTDIVLEYKITDCAAVPAGPWPVPVRVKRAWGQQTEYLPMSTMFIGYAPDEHPYNGVGARSEDWQRALANGACAMPD